VPPRITKLLHVEDSMLPRRILAQQFAAAKDYSFVITCVASEDEAIREFTQGGVDCVVLDYHLTQGDGLSCLRRLRQLDPIVPIVAVSGEATAEIAAELLRVGADDYISKADLLSGAVPRSVCAALARADALRRYQAASSPDQTGTTRALLQQVCQAFAARVGPDLLERLDQWEAAARQESLTMGQLEHAFEAACSELADPAGSSSTQRLLRPILLEMVLRLAGQPHKNRAASE
jgi:CheY-like chemotaxis protein